MGVVNKNEKKKQHAKLHLNVFNTFFHSNKAARSKSWLERHSKINVENVERQKFKCDQQFIF